MNMHLTGPLEVFSHCHLWLAVFDATAGDSLARQLSELPASKMCTRDLARWRQFRTLEKKRQFLNSRIAMRSILQKELKHSSDDVHFHTNRMGQPILLSANVKELPPISLSHSGTAVAVAVSHGGAPIGVDIEVVAPLRADALRHFAANPSDSGWQHQHGRMSEAEFLRTLWTIRESVWKSIGGVDGISISRILVDYDAHGMIIPRAIHPSFAYDKFRTRLFAMQCEAVFPNTMLVKQSSADIMALRGSFTQRIPTGCCESRGDFAGSPLRID